MESFQGSFRYNAGASDDVDQAINRAIAPLNTLVRQVARPRLRSVTRPAERIAIASTSDALRIVWDPCAPIVVTGNGASVDWKGEDGQSIKVGAEFANDRLSLVFRAQDGQRSDLYSLSPSGDALTVNVTVASDRLPKPLIYKLVYRRV